MKQKLLLHVCCAVCASALVESLKEKYDLSLYFYNPNIYPIEEYEKRKMSVIALAKDNEVNYFDGDYEQDKWLEKVRGLEEEPEGGERCKICFGLRLFKTALFAEKHNFLYFSTTLIQSHLKNEDLINSIGKDISERIGVKYLNFEDFKINKKESFKRTQEISKEKGYYRQNYCGCKFAK